MVVFIGFLIGAVVGILITLAYLVHLLESLTGVNISGCLVALVLLVLITGCSIGLLVSG